MRLLSSKYAVGNLSLFLSLELLRRGSHAQIDTPVNTDDLDPMKTCRRWDSQITVVGKTAFIYGGTSIVRNGTEPTYPIMNSYLRKLDLSSSFDLSSSNIPLVAERIPPEIPILQGNAFWGADGSLFVLGGQGVPRWYINESFGFDGTHWENHYMQVYRYRISSGVWSTLDPVPPQDGSVVNAPVNWALWGWDNFRNVGYAYGGDNDMGTRTDFPGDSNWNLDISQPVNYEWRSMITLDTDSAQWSNDTFPTMPDLGGGQLLSFANLGTRNEGILVAIGGRWIKSGTMQSLRQVSVYDVGSKTWFNQTTTMPRDRDASGRWSFCAVTGTAPDNSSHNIYIYGGAKDTDGYLADVWILSLPSFRWIYGGTSDRSRAVFGCAKVAKRYLLVYGDMTENVQGNECDNDQNGFAMLDLQSLEWTSSYEAPEGTPTYLVPERIYSVIGGDANGGATLTAESYNTPSITALFNSDPTSTSSPSDSGDESNDRPTDDPNSDSGSGSSAGAIAGGVVGGVAFVGIILGVLFFWRRRKAKIQAKAAVSPVMEHKPPPYYQMTAELDTGRPPVELMGDHQYVYSAPVNNQSVARYM
ncbi:hypothetical protein M501DRAFT_1004268 [Patellaria atrata CBS 101060]|uniref:Kelch repeat protein n=1 Tax=Patellaria atrata CBS 101060 TaxID=1346257 RepID=A0A9P4S9H7_9PEZI|nr:hypothetical protein M501DRAFT_1004268 [Patellaria atrata CBS 101060]